MESIKQFFRITEFVAQEALASMARSAWMSWLVVVTIAVSLSILGGSWLVVQDLRAISHEIGSQVKLQVFLNADADAKGVEQAVKEMPNIKATTIVLKDQAWEQLQSDMKSKMTFDNLLDENPLPDTLSVETIDPMKTAETAEAIKKLQGVDDVEYAADLLKKLGEIATFLRAAGFTIAGVIGLASLAVIMNTIRLAVMSRKREIEIMHLVGASNSFIAFPFLLEGMLFGLFGTILTAGALFGWRYFTFGKWQQLFPFVPMQMDLLGVAWTVAWLALIGMGLGALGSMLSVRKHIRLAVE
ncbi:Cell division protein FtsX [compost metagenome]